MREYRSEFTVAWAHCDAAGIVFYPYFYTWFDQATERLFSANALSYAEMACDFGVSGMPLLETGATFRNACRLGDVLSMASHVAGWDGKPFTVRHTLRHADGRPALEGFEKRVWVIPAPDRPAGIRAIPVPEEVRARFAE